MKTWRGEAAEDIEELAIAVEGRDEPAAGPVAVKDEPKPAAADAEAKKAPAKKAPAARKTTAKKTTPPAK